MVYLDFRRKQYLFGRQDMSIENKTYEVKDWIFIINNGLYLRRLKLTHPELARCPLIGRMAIYSITKRLKFFKETVSQATRRGKTSEKKQKKSKE